MISIIALLIVILLPRLRKVRCHAKRVLCQTNLKQIAIEWHDDLPANDDKFLKGINANWNYGGQQGALPAFGTSDHPKEKPLNPFLALPLVVTQGAEIFRCPEDKGGGDVPTTHFIYKGTSYVTNLMLVGQTRLATFPFDPCFEAKKLINQRLRDLSRSQVSNEAKLILVGDAGWLNSWEFNLFKPIDWHHQPSQHNIAFMDGHVDFIRIRKGLHVTPTYHVVPFQSLLDPAQECQLEVPSG